MSGNMRTLSKARKNPLGVGWILVLAVVFFASSGIFLGSCGNPERDLPGNTTGGTAADIPNTLPEKPSPKDLPGIVFVSIGNNPSARPQSGLSKAAIVFEAPAEGGITRLLAGFTKETEEIGPVRSARKCLLEIAIGYDAPFAHCGGSKDSFEIIRHDKTKSLDEINSAGECFWRTKDRSAPDNLYTSTANLIKGAEKRGFSVPSISLFPKGEFLGEPCKSIEYNFSKLKDYPNQVTYTYESERYQRSINGVPHKDKDGDAIAPLNLVFLEVKTTYLKGQETEIDMDIQGEGKALFLSGGLLAKGTWKKPSRHEPLKFYIGQREVPFAQGLIWVHLVPELSEVVMTAGGTK